MDNIYIQYSYRLHFIPASPIQTRSRTSSGAGERTTKRVKRGRRLRISSDEDEDEDINENSEDESSDSVRCHSKAAQVRPRPRPKKRTLPQGGVDNDSEAEPDGIARKSLTIRL